ncbi:MAG: AraC family transcriptional regulator [Rhodobacteraceae bacterium]|nr:AraC family transcriptional regulator [Paracoccaceae bacterium]
MTIDELRRAAAEFADLARAGATPVATPVPGLTIVRSRAPTEIAPVLYEPLFCLVLQGAKQTSVDGRMLSFRAGQSLVVSHDRPSLSRIVEASAASPYLALALTLDVHVAAEIAAEMETHGAVPEAAGGAVRVGPTSPGELDAMARLFGLIGDAAAVRVLAPTIAREVHFHVLAAGHGAVLKRLGRRDSHASRITRAIAAIRRGYAGPLRIADLAGEAGMSASAFHEHFRDFTGTTPLQFQKHLRLMEARRLILEAGQGVAPAAYAVGYESPTQFSREYSRAFGVAPSRDRPDGAEIAAE